MSHRLQEQVLVSRQLSQQALRVDFLDRKAGIVEELTDPFNIFLDITDLLDRDSLYVYLIVYTIGKKKLLITGLYDKATRDFIINKGCRYDIRQLANLIKIWKGKGYQYAGNMVVDRAQKRFDELLPELSKTPDIPNYQSYRKFKYLIPYLKRDYSKLSVEELGAIITVDDIIDFERQVEDKYQPQSSGEFMERYYEYIEELEDQIELYEEKLNRHDVNNAISDYGASIVAEFTRFLLTSNLNSSTYYADLDACPSINYCQDPWEYIPECSLYYHGQYPYIYTDDSSRLR